jgi:hypothetical protein
LKLKPSFVLSIAALVIAVTPVHARSCSDFKAVCMSRAEKPERCDGAWKRCMKSGTYIGPESGTNHGTAEKR